MYKWTLAVQIHVVQGLTVYSQSHTTITSIMLFRSREREKEAHTAYFCQDSWNCRVIHMCSITRSCSTLCNPMDCNLSGSSVHGTFQARVLEQVAVSYSR